MLLSLIKIGTYNSIKTDKNHPPSLYKNSFTILYQETKCTLTDYNLFLFNLGVPWCARYR